MNVVIYARFSSHSQTEQSIEGQYRDSKYWRNSNNMGITTYSGKITYKSVEGNNITVLLEQLYNYLQFDLMREVLNFVDRK